MDDNQQSTTMPPASEPFPGSRTPGWNDPPPMNYNAIGSTTSVGNRPRLDLKKRVAYPLQGTVAGKAAGMVTKPTAIVPPNQLIANLSPPPPPSLSLNQTGTSPVNIAVVHPMPQNTPVVLEDNSFDLPENALTESLQILRCQIRCIPETANLRQEDIRSRILHIERQWQSGELNANLKQKIYQLGQAIKNRNYGVAMHIYTYLVVNHGNQCSSWATALRHIIFTIEERGERNGSVIDSQARNTNNSNVTATTSGSSVNNVNMFVANSSHHSTGTATAVQHI